MSTRTGHYRRQIALVVHDFSRGFGHGRYCVELARHLQPLHDIHIFANHFGVPCEPGWTFQKVPAVRRSALLTIFTFLSQAEKRLARRKFDLIHSQGVTCWRADVITAHLCNAARVEKDALRSPKERLFDTLTGQLETEFYRRNRDARWIAVSGQTANELLTEHEPVHPVPVIYHGVDTELFHPLGSRTAKAALRDRLGLPVDRWLWLFVGEASKGLLPALQALRQFPKATLLVISRSSAAEWLGKAAGIGVLPQVLWPGPQTFLTPFYQSADVFVYPSEYDAFGMVVAEAMSSGLPVITTRKIGAAEWIRHGENGLLGPISEPEALNAQLRQIDRLPDRGAQLGENARDTASRYSWKRCAEATLRVYEQTWKPLNH
ncbi:MAG TPA: glycosyltransferase family 4 protein [Verrucomicrobiae bacterium]